MPYAPAPIPPSRKRPATFEDEYDDFMGWLPPFGDYLEEVRLAAEDAIAAAPGAIAAAQFRGEYSAGTTYQIGHSVSYGGDTWYAKIVNTGITPVAGANWQRIIAVPAPAGNDGKVLGAADGLIDWVYVVSPGSVIHHAASTPPAGFLKANGAAVSRTTYAALFAAIGVTFGVGNGSTTFTLPDLRGYFFRGWDDGRGVDAARVFGSAQADENLSHTHTGTTNTTGSHTHANGITLASGSGPSSGLADNLNTTSVMTTNFSYPSTGSAGSHSHSVSIVASGGTEARPKNIALLACIKY